MGVGPKLDGVEGERRVWPGKFSEEVTFKQVTEGWIGVRQPEERWQEDYSKEQHLQRS